MTKSRYHHGDLRAALLASAADHVATDGVDSVSLRTLAQRAGVSHAAPAHHFGNREGLLTELAVEGFELLTKELDAAGDDFLEVALAYIRFARTHPGHFDVMYRHDLLRTGDARLVHVRAQAGELLRSGAARYEGASVARRTTALAAWSLVHGFASLWREGALQDSELGDDDPDWLAREMLTAVDLRSKV